MTRDVPELFAVLEEKHDRKCIGWDCMVGFGQNKDAVSLDPAGFRSFIDNIKRRDIGDDEFGLCLQEVVTKLFCG